MNQRRRKTFPESYTYRIKKMVEQEVKITFTKDNILHPDLTKYIKEVQELQDFEEMEKKFKEIGEMINSFLFSKVPFPIDRAAMGEK